MRGEPVFANYFSVGREVEVVSIDFVNENESFHSFFRQSVIQRLHLKSRWSARAPIKSDPRLATKVIVPFPLFSILSSGPRIGKDDQNDEV
jgi:hypothetical protein